MIREGTSCSEVYRFNFVSSIDFSIKMHPTKQSINAHSHNIYLCILRDRVLHSLLTRLADTSRRVSEDRCCEGAHGWEDLTDERRIAVQYHISLYQVSSYAGGGCTWVGDVSKIEPCIGRSS